MHRWGFPGGSPVMNLPANAGALGSSPGLGRSPGEGNGNLLQYSCLENPMDRRAWWATVHGVTKESDMTERLNNSNAQVWRLFALARRFHLVSFSPHPGEAGKRLPPPRLTTGPKDTWLNPPQVGTSHPSCPRCFSFTTGSTVFKPKLALLAPCTEN